MGRIRRPPFAAPPRLRQRPWRRPRRHKWLVIICLVCAAGLGGWLWLRSGHGSAGSSVSTTQLPSDASRVIPVPQAPAENPTQPPESRGTSSTLLEKDFHPRPPRDVLEAQIALSRDSICPGSIDGAWGRQTRAAVVAYQQKHGLPVTAQLDNKTREQLQLEEPPFATYTVTAEDLTRLRPAAKGWLQLSQLDRLDYTSVLELVAEKHYARPSLIRRLNPDVDWENIRIGTVIEVPNVKRSKPDTPPALIVIHLSEKTLQVFDAHSKLLAHFPCSIARKVEKRPVGRLEVVEAAKGPNYTFDPANFPDSPEAQQIGRKLILQPGPNNPVGTAWIGLSRAGYGIHGSPTPETVGRVESSGCFRLANWNADYLLPLTYTGLPVDVEL